MPIENIKPDLSKFPLFYLGFRPFFLSAGLFAIATIFLWSLVYFSQINIPFDNISGFAWHAHEMVYGYGMAVIAGFLLTATKNWTKIQTPHGFSLLLIFSLWLIARVLFAFGFINLAGIFDLAFNLWLIIAVTQPILKTRQWQQLAIIGKLIFLSLFNLSFYAGVSGNLADARYWGIYGGLYLTIGLILMMGRRVVPFFIERGINPPVKVSNYKFIDIASLVVYLLFLVVEITGFSPGLSAWCALAMFCIIGIRLFGWYNSGIWQKPLLWSLYIAFIFISLGFLLFFISYISTIPKYFAIHALSYGGIGTVTLGMMSRVALGHTGRDINRAPQLLGLSFLLLIIGTVFRVALPLLLPEKYDWWLVLSQALWIGAFGIFVFLYLPILTRPRLDR